MKKKLNLSAKPLSFISIDENGRNSYCKTHCQKYNQFEYRNNLCFLSCSYGECILDNEPLSKDEIVSTLKQIQSQIISDEFKQQQKQKINNQKDDVKLNIETFCDKLIQQLEKNCELQNQLNEKLKYFLDNQDQINYSEIYEILKQQQLENVSIKLTVNSSLSKEFNKILTRYDLILKIIQQITIDDDNNRNKDEKSIFKQLEQKQIRDQTFVKLHEISIKPNKNVMSRIYQDQKNQQIIIINQAAENNNQITIIQPSQYSLFGQIETIKNTVQVDFFTISLSGQYYAWAYNNKVQVYNLIKKLYSIINCQGVIDQIAFNLLNELAICTEDQKINFWAIVDKLWEQIGSFNMLPERVFDLIFIENGKKLVCKSQSKLTILIKENQNWIIHQQIHQEFGQILWSPNYSMIITTNMMQQIQFWTKNKRDQYQIIQTEWDIDFTEMRGLTKFQMNEDGTLLFQNKANQVKIWAIKNEGKLEQIFEQNINERELYIMNDFTNIIAQNEKSMIWYQMINDE